MTKQQLESMVQKIVRQELSNLIKNPKFLQLITKSILQETLSGQNRQVQQPQQKPKMKKQSLMAGDVLSDVNYSAQNNYQAEKKRRSSRVQEVLKQKVKNDDLDLNTDFWGDELQAPRKQNIQVPEYIKNNPIMAQTAREMTHRQAVESMPANDNMILRQVTSGIGFEIAETDDYRSIDSSVTNAQALNEAYGGNQGGAISRVGELYNEQVSEVMNGPSVMDLSPAAKRKFSFLNRDYGELI